MRLWDVDAKVLIRKFEGHRGVVFALAFSPDGRYALSGGADGTARLWRLPNVEEGLRAASTSGPRAAATTVERFQPGRYKIEVYDETLNADLPSLDATFGEDQRFQATNGNNVLRGMWELRGDRLLVTAGEFGDIEFVSTDGRRTWKAPFFDTGDRRRKRLTMSRSE